MEYKITFDEELVCFVVSATGPATARDIHSFVNELLNNSRWRRGRNVIIDYRLADLSVLTSSNAHDLANYVMRLKERIGSRRVAHVVSQNVDFGMVRTWENLVEDQVAFDFRVFHSMDDARKWIADTSTT